MRVLIFEPQFAGHNLAHAARLVRSVADLGCQPVLATSPQALASDEFDLHLAGLRERFELFQVQGLRSDKLGRRLRTNGVGALAGLYRGLVRSIRSTRPGHVYVPCGNLLARFGWLPFGLSSALQDCGAEAETLIIGGRYLQRPRNRKERLRQQLVLNMIGAGPWRHVHQCNDATDKVLRRHGGRLAEIARLMPDPIGHVSYEGRQQARRALGLPLEGRSMAVVGLVEKRKGIRELATAFRDSSSRLRADDRLLLLGSFHPDVHAMLQGEFADLLDSGRVVIIDRRLSQADFGRAIRAADVVATVYPHHPYTASMVVAAAASRRPVLASDSGWIGRTVRRFGLGWRCEPGDPNDMADAVLAALHGCENFAPTAAADRFLRYCSDANFGAHWTVRLRQRLGLPADPEFRTWEWACDEALRAAAPPPAEASDREAERQPLVFFKRITRSQRVEASEDAS
ncbi:MAG: glycosyltransferase [Planctomycetota bacterium]